MVKVSNKTIVMPLLKKNSKFCKNRPDLPQVEKENYGIKVFMQ